jgi:competence protein CoiA
MSSNKDNEHLLKSAEEVGCLGLVDGAAMGLKTNQLYFASTSSKSDGPFYCTSCYSDAVLRKCADKKDHFAHKTPLSPVLPKGESELHEQCKSSICEYLKGKFPEGKWETERPIEENKEKKLSALRPDASGRINGQPVCIEVQASSLTIPEIIKRTKSYAKRKVAILWVVPLSEKLKSTPFRPRLYERYFHSIYYGRVYYWWPELGSSLAPVHFGVAQRHIEYSSWHDENGDFQEAGDYDKAYKVIKTPDFGPTLDIDEDFYFHPRNEFTPENERKAVPACLIWKDKLDQWWK